MNRGIVHVDLGEEQQSRTDQVKTNRSAGDRDFGENGVHFRGTQFGSLNRIPNNPELDPPSRLGHQFTCDFEHSLFFLPWLIIYYFYSKKKSFFLSQKRILFYRIRFSYECIK